MKHRRKGERKDGLIQRSLMIGRKKDGSPDRVYFYGHSIKEAEAKKQKYKERLEYGVDHDYDNITVSEWIDLWYEKYILGAKRTQLLSASSKAGYASRIKQLKHAIGSMRMKDVREHHLQEALYNVHGESRDAAAKYAGFVRRIFKKAKTNRVILDNPAEALDTPDGTKGTHRALQRWEVDLILSNWDKHRCGIWAVTMMLTGMRRGELVAQEWKNIDLVNRRISITNAARIDESIHFVDGPTKSEAGIRTLPICKSLLVVLESIPEEKRNGKLCRNAKGGPITPSSFRKGWQSYRKAMWRIANGQPMNQQGRRTDKEPPPDSETSFNWRTHDLRFTFATAMYDAGVPVKAAQYYMGHADIRLTLDLYTQLSAEREKESNIQLTSFLDNWISKEMEAKIDTIDVKLV